MQTTTGPKRARWVGVVLAPLVWLERTKGRKRGLLLLAYGLILAVIGLFAWRAGSLNGLPDVGDPFDVRAFAARKVPDERNALAVYRQAVRRLKKTTATQNFSGMWGVIRGGWPKASPTLRQWVDENREALALWRQGTERPEAQCEPGDDFLPDFGRPGVSRDLLEFVYMALLEGSRLEEQGDMAGAWGWYGASLRAGRHGAMCGGYQGWANAQAIDQLTGERITPWARDGRTGAAELRRALDDVQAVAAMTRPASEALKLDYLRVMRALDDPDRWTARADAGHPWFNQRPEVLKTALFLKREPERTRRIYRLIFSHWLSQCDRPPAQRIKLTTDVVLYAWGTPIHNPDLPYAVPPTGLDAVHPISARQLAGWMHSAIYVNSLMPPTVYAQQAFDGERSGRAVLLVTLAEQCYIREHGGKEPESPTELVGPYLKSLPEGYEDDAKATHPGR